MLEIIGVLDADPYFSIDLSLLVIKDSYLLINRLRSSELSKSNSSSSSKASFSSPSLSELLSFFLISYLLIFLLPRLRSLISFPFNNYSMVESRNDSFWFTTLLPFLVGDSPFRGRISVDFLFPEFLFVKFFSVFLA